MSNLEMRSGWHSSPLSLFGLLLSCCQRGPAIAVVYGVMIVIITITTRGMSRSMPRTQMTPRTRMTTNTGSLCGSQVSLEHLDVSLSVVVIANYVLQVGSPPLDSSNAAIPTSGDCSQFSPRCPIRLPLSNHCQLSASQLSVNQKVVLEYISIFRSVYHRIEVESPSAWPSLDALVS